MADCAGWRMAERAKRLFPNMATVVQTVFIRFRYRGEVAMKKLLLLIAILGGAIAVIRNLPAEQRKRLAQLPAALMGGMMEHMPDN